METPVESVWMHLRCFATPQLAAVLSAVSPATRLPAQGLVSASSIQSSAGDTSPLRRSSGATSCGNIFAWWELRSAADSRRLRVFFPEESSAMQRQDVAALRERNLSTPDAPPPPTLDLRTARLKSLSVASSFGSTVVIFRGSPPVADASAFGAHLFLSRSAQGSLESVSLLGVTFLYSSKSLESLSQMSTLVSVVLRGCRQLAGWSDLANLPRLQLLDLGECRIESLDVQCFATSAALQTLLIDGNRPLSLRTLPTTVTRLDVANSDLESFDDLAVLRNLRNLRCANNNPYEGSLRFMLKRLTNLQVLDVSACGRVPADLIGRTAPLTTLTIGCFPLEGLSTAEGTICNGSHLTHLKVLKVLQAASAELREIPFIGPSMQVLVSVVILDGDFRGTAPFCALAAVPSLEKIVLRRCKLASVHGVDACQRLRWIDLEGNYFSGLDCNPELERLVSIGKSLEYVSLKDAAVEDLEWLDLSRFPALRDLNLAGNAHLSTGGNRLAEEASSAHGEVNRSLETLYLAPTFPFDLGLMAQRLVELQTLHHVHPCVLPEPVCFPFRNVGTVSIHENSLVHGMSLTFRFLQKLSALFPCVSTLILGAASVTDGHIEALQRVVTVECVVLAPTASFSITSVSTAWWFRLTKLRRIVVACLGRKHVEAAAARWIYDGIAPNHVTVQLRNEVPWWESDPV